MSVDSDKVVTTTWRTQSFHQRQHGHAGPQLYQISHSSNNVLRARRGVIRMLIIVVLTFALCNLPLHARKMWQYWWVCLFCFPLIGLDDLMYWLGSHYARLWWQGLGRTVVANQAVPFKSTNCYYLHALRWTLACAIPAWSNTPSNRSSISENFTFCWFFFSFIFLNVNHNHGSHSSFFRFSKRKRANDSEKRQ